MQHAVAGSDIAVLSQYRAQHNEMQTALQHYSGVTVSTVAAAQGIRNVLCRRLAKYVSEFVIFHNRCLEC